MSPSSLRLPPPPYLLSPTTHRPLHTDPHVNPHCSQLEDCKAAIDEVRAAFPDAEEPALLDAALLRKQKKSLEEQFAVLTVRARLERAVWMAPGSAFVLTKHV